MMILAIDPGSEKSAWLLWRDGHILDKFIESNDDLLNRIRFWFRRINDDDTPKLLVIEQVESFGMPVGKTIFETVFWSGRFAEAYGYAFARIGRMKIKNHLCHSSRAKDSNIRQALIDRFGPPGTKKQPGATYGISKDLWSALAIAVTYSDTTGE